MGIKLGLDGKLYLLPTGTRATWGTLDADTGITEGAAPAGLTEMDNVKNLTLNLEKGQAEVSTRKQKGWKAQKGTLKSGTVEFAMVYDTSDSGVQALLSAYLLNKSVAAAVLDGASSEAGTQGLWADFDVVNFGRNEQLEEGMEIPVTLAPTYSAVAPEWVKVTGGGS